VTAFDTIIPKYPVFKDVLLYVGSTFTSQILPCKVEDPNPLAVSMSLTINKEWGTEAAKVITKPLNPSFMTVSFDFTNLKKCSYDAKPTLETEAGVYKMMTKFSVVELLLDP